MGEALRGLLAIIFGIVALLFPPAVLATLVLLFGAYTLVDGIFDIVLAVRTAQQRARWWPFLVEGLIDIAIGVVTFVWPNITALALLFLVAAWAILTGILRVIAAIRLRKAISNEWLLIVSGILSVAVGVLFAIFPGAGALAVVQLIDAFAVVLGVLIVILSFRLRGLKQSA
ncbi:MAG: HdeD family acid-resistance protein [Anaerolineae bacterium]